MRLLNRRYMLAGMTCAVGAGVTSTVEAGPVSDDPNDWLGRTRLINFEHSAVHSITSKLVSDKTTDLEKALTLFRFVRDEIKFGFARGFWNNKASDVLTSRVGYCNTKSTLFIALLRASDIPARQVFVDIKASVLHGIINPGTPYVDHSYVEVFIDGAWVATDAYIVDTALFGPAQTRTVNESRLMGYGVHATGSNEWDGRSASFSQFNILDPRPISTRRWGVYEDVATFYARTENTWNRLNPLLRRGFGALAAGANRRADRLRESSVG